jgi:ABC-type multidrug transport system ATPase subunit
VELQLKNIGKKYHREWIFRSVDLQLASSSHWALLGGNGTGKSTLIKILSGYLTPTEGLIAWKQNDRSVEIQKVHQHVALCAPYQSPFSEFTLSENFDFFAQFKGMQNGLHATTFAQLLQLEHAIDKPLKSFSSGMLQRVKLGLAICSSAPLLLLDEPSSHLDHTSTQWYCDLLTNHMAQRTVVIATNEPTKDLPMPCKQLDIQQLANKSSSKSS